MVREEVFQGTKKIFGLYGALFDLVAQEIGIEGKKRTFLIGLNYSAIKVEKFTSWRKYGSTSQVGRSRDPASCHHSRD